MGDFLQRQRLSRVTPFGSAFAPPDCSQCAALFVRRMMMLFDDLRPRTRLVQKVYCETYDCWFFPSLIFLAKLNHPARQSVTDIRIFINRHLFVECQMHICGSSDTKNGKKKGEYSTHKLNLVLIWRPQRWCMV